MILLDVVGVALNVTDFNLEMIPLIFDVFHCFVGLLQLVSKMINVSLQSLDFCNVVLFFLLQLLQVERGATHVLFQIEALLIKLVVLLLLVFDGFNVSFVFCTRIPIVLKNILLFHFQCPNVLMGESLLVL